MLLVCVALVNFADCNHNNPHQRNHISTDPRNLIGSVSADASRMSKSQPRKASVPRSQAQGGLLSSQVPLFDPSGDTYMFRSESRVCCMAMVNFRFSVGKGQDIKAETVMRLIWKRTYRSWLDSIVMRKSSFHYYQRERCISW